MDSTATTRSGVLSGGVAGGSLKFRSSSPCCCGCLRRVGGSRGGGGGGEKCKTPRRSGGSRSYGCRNDGSHRSSISSRKAATRWVAWGSFSESGKLCRGSVFYGEM